MIEARMSIMPQTFVVVGCGGTGSRLVPLIAQFIKTCAWIIDPIIYLIDDDVVEAKNLLRQNFIPLDVGKPKAQVLASRYSKAYNITIIPLVMKVERSHAASDAIFPSSRRIDSEISGNIRSTMIISCVDNMEARRNILHSFYNVWSYGGIFLDGGNEDVYGQVMIANPNCLVAESSYDNASSLKELNSRLGLPELLPVKGTAQHIPLDLNFYNSTEDKASERSCADLDQTMAINAMVATTMFSIIQMIVYSRPINFYRLNISMAGTFPELLTMSNILRLTSSYNDYRKIQDSGRLSNLVGNFSIINIKHYVTNLLVEYDKFIKSTEVKKLKEEKLVIAETSEGIEIVDVPAVPPPLVPTPIRPRARMRLDIPVISATPGNIATISSV